MAQDPGNLIQFLRGLRAVREYTDQPISDEALNDILDVGRWSGSASNSQMTEIIVVSSPEIKHTIADGGVRAAAGCALALVIVTTGDAQRRDLEIFDEGRLVERLLLAASAHGLGANIGTLKGEGPAVVKEALGVPAERRAWSVVTLGHTDAAAFAARARNPRAGRKPLSEFVHWDRYGSHR
jgi:nitroreductase